MTDWIILDLHLQRTKIVSLLFVAKVFLRVWISSRQQIGVVLTARSDVRAHLFVKGGGERVVERQLHVDGLLLLRADWSDAELLARLADVSRDRLLRVREAVVARPLLVQHLPTHTHTCTCTYCNNPVKTWP